MFKTIFVAFLLLADGAAPVAAREPASWWETIVQMGAIGGVLAWFMIRNEPRLRAIEASIDTVSRTLILTILAMRGCDKGLQEQAQKILDEVKQRTGQ